MPLPSRERMRIAPAWSVTSEEVMARPRPEPRWLLVNWFSTCSNGLPSFFSASLGMPMPVSATEKVIALAEARARAA